MALAPTSTYKQLPSSQKYKRAYSESDDAISSFDLKRDKAETVAPAETAIKEKSSDPKSAIKPGVKIGSITVTGNITQADVRQQLDALLDDIGKCYQKSFGQCSQWPQTVIATMVIGSQGADVNFKVSDGKTLVKGFYKCMESLFRKMKLTPSDQKGAVKIVVTFVRN